MPKPFKTHFDDFMDLLEGAGGKPFIQRQGDLLSLHFNGGAIQSEMRVSAPDQLMFSYTRAMMGFLLFQPAPKHLLMVGLGGGSIVKFCYRYLPDTRITVLELDADVIALRDQFLIPPDDARLRVIHADAADFMEGAAQDIDVLLLDGFGAEGLPPELCSAHFYAACRRVLNPHGVLVANIIDRDPQLPFCMQYLHAEYGLRVCWCRAEGGGNRIVFAINGGEGGVNAALPCRAHIRLQANVVQQAGSMLPETPASPPDPSPAGESHRDSGTRKSHAGRGEQSESLRDFHVNECQYDFRPQLRQRAEASSLRCQLNLPQLVERLRCRHA